MNSGKPTPYIISHDTHISNMSFICLGCKKNFRDNRRACAGHCQRCARYLDTQQETLRGSGNFDLGATSSVLHDHTTTSNFDEPQADFLLHKEASLQSSATTSAPLTIVLLPVSHVPLHDYFPIPM
jgi:predicted amidophosphoribosyltransferase